MNGTVNFKVRRVSDGWEGTITLPSSGGAASAIVTAKGPTKNSAMTRATGLANQVLQSPVFKALIPPQAALAIKAAGALAKVGPKIARVAVNVLKSKPLKSLAKLFGG
jgi:hypothetical protein